MDERNTFADLFLHFGFSQQEVDIYIAALALKNPSVTDIAEKLKKNRTAVYFHINNLIEKGLLEKTRVGRKFVLSPLAPGRFAEQADRWTTDLKSIVPQLEAMARIDREYPTIRIEESKRGYYRVYDEIVSLPKGSLFRVLEGRAALEKELTLLTSEQWKTFFERIIDRGIQTKAIFTEESLKVPSKKLNAENIGLVSKRIWHLRSILEENLPFQQLMILYGSRAAFLFPGKSLVMTIEHDGVVACLQVMFDALFMTADVVRQRWNEL